MTRTWQVGLITLAVLAAAGLRLASRQPREPEYDGQPLRYYLSSQTYGDLRREREAREAIREMGSNAVPCLMEILSARESWFAHQFRQLLRRQSLVRLNLVPLAERQRHAAMACLEIGPAAAPAIPALARLVDDPDLACWAIAALSQIGPQTFPLLTNALLNGRLPLARVEAAGDLRYMQARHLPVPALLQALKEPIPLVRSRALDTLGFLGCRPDLVVPALIACLEDPDVTVRLSAVRSLGWFRSDAASAIPALLELFRREESTALGHEVREALNAIDPAVVEGAGTKASRLP